MVSETTKYPAWVDTKTLTDETTLNGNNADIVIETFVDRVVVSRSVFEDKLMGAVAIKVYDAHTKKLLNQYRDYTLISGKQVLHHYSGTEQEKNDELVQATKNTLDYLAGTLAKNVCSFLDNAALMESFNKHATTSVEQGCLWRAVRATGFQVCFA